MKKIISVLLAAVMILSICSTAFAKTGFDMSYFEEGDTFTIEIDDDGDTAFIYYDVSAAIRSFVHKYESNEYYSTFDTDIIIVDYDKKSDRYPVLRTWIDYRADEYMNFESVSFIIDGKEYLFSDISLDDSCEELEVGIREDLLVKYGDYSEDFVNVLFEKSYELLSQASEEDELNFPEMKMILHGKEDIEADVSEGFWYQMSLTLIGLDNSGQLDRIFDVDGCPCSVKKVK